MRRTSGVEANLQPFAKGKASSLSFLLHVWLLSQGLKGEYLSFREQTAVLYFPLAIFFLLPCNIHGDSGLTIKMFLEGKARILRCYGWFRTLVQPNKRNENV